MPMTNSPPYHNGYIDAATRLQPAFEQYDLNMAIITIVLALFGLFFNLIIFYAFWGMRKSGSAMIFLNLAAVDVVLTCCAMPFSITTLLIRSEGGSAPHYVFCAVTGSLFETCVLCTLGFVLLASIDRFLGVYYPIYHRKYFSRTNLIRMIVSVWTISPLLILIYITLWLLLSSTPKKHTFTNKNIFTTCIGQYWFKSDKHVIGNAPSYITVSLLSLLMILVVIGNLAVLKQLFRKKPKPLESLQPANKSRQRRNNTTLRTPPIVIQPDGSSEVPERVEVAREQLKRISLAEQSVKKSERIFQTDSHGDIIGINIRAIIKLYVMATRASQACMSRCSKANGSETSSLLEDGKEIETIHPLVTSEPPLPDSSFNNDVEVKEDIVFIPEGAIEKDETLGIIDEPNIYMDGENLEIGSLSEFPEDEETGNFGDDEIDYEVVWKVIKFVSTLKRNSRKRQASELTRCSSDTDLSILQENSDFSTYKTDNSAADSRHISRKYSELASSRVPRPSFPYEVPNSMNEGGDMDNPTIEEINEMVNGGELSPLVRRHKMKPPDLASITKFASDIKKRSKEKVMIHRRSTTALLSSLGGRKGTLSNPRTSVHEEDSFFKECSKTRPSASQSWGTLVAITRIKSKLMRSTTKHIPEYDNPLPTKTELIPIPETAEETQEHTETDAADNNASQDITPDPISEEEADEETEEEADEDPPITENTKHRDLLAVPSNSSLTIPPLQTNSTPNTPARQLSSDSYTSQGYNPRRQGVNDSPCFSPNGDMSVIEGNQRKGSFKSNSGPSIRQRMRDSSVYRISRSSVNISGVAQMVYNFNKQAQKKKKEIRAAKTIIILVFYYIITLLLFIVAFYHVAMMGESEKATMPYWLTFYSYIIYLNAVLNPVIHFWRNAKVRATVMKIICPNTVNEKFRRWKLRGGF